MTEGRSAPRFEISVQGKYRTGSGFARHVSILDISETGCRMMDKFARLEVGSTITLRIGPIGPVEATVAWSENRVVGIEFDRRLYGPVFEHIRDQVAAANRAA